MNAAPVTPQEFASCMQALGSFEHQPSLAIAVSGGADSMALLILARQWLLEHDGDLIALTVDHGLRTESAQEAVQVAAYCKALGIRQQTLTWHPPALTSAIQSSAREARYRLLTGYCRRHGILHLLTAHHRDDQVETLFFRLARGSELKGLACMPPVSNASGVRLLRPLLPFPKARLEATLMQHTQPWLEDPSNRNPAFTRNHIRQQLHAYPEYEALAARSCHVAQKFGFIRNHLELIEASQLSQCVALYPEGYARIHKSRFLSAPPGARPAMLAQLATTLSGSPAQPRSEQVRRLLDELPDLTSTRSFNGLLFTAMKDHILVHRENSAMSGAIELERARPALWDGRFLCCWHGKDGLPAPVVLKALGAAGISKLAAQAALLPKQNRLSGMKMILATLPAFWHLEEVIAVPHMNYVNPAFRHIIFTARHMPAKPLAGRCFFSMNMSQHMYVKEA